MLHLDRARSRPQAARMPSRRRTQAYQIGTLLICAAMVSTAVWMVAVS